MWQRMVDATISLCNVSGDTEEQCGRTRVSPMQRDKLRHVRAHHARTMQWRVHGARARAAIRRAETANRAFDRVVVQMWKKRCRTIRSNG
eukprot:8071873-Lingulodinium_polyedra.AAC.1